MAIKKISANLLANNAVHTANIASGAISAADIANNSITAAKLSTSTFAIDSLTVNTSDLVVDTANNRVGIGTTTPATLVDIVGTGTDILRVSAPTQPVLRISRTSGAELDVTTSSAQAVIRTNTNHPIDFLTNGTQAMRIDTSQNVGIGTSSPSQPLDVAGNIQTNGIYRAYDSVSTNYRNVLGYDSGNVKLQTGTGSSSYGISLFTAGTERLTINGSGNVGIGTGSPTAKLEVNGGDSYFYNTATTGGIRIGYDSSNYWDIKRENASVGNLRFYHSGNERVSFLPGGGITFNGDTAAANALDDYEEGTWTPADDNGNNYYDSGVQATYTKIGRVVYFHFDIQNTQYTSGTKISGLPYTSASGTANNWSVYGGYSTSNADLWGHINANSTRINMYVGSGAHTLSGRWIGAGWYYAS